MSEQSASELKKFGDENYGPYGYGWCNPAFYSQEPVPNEAYLATIPEDDPWKPALVDGFARLDREYPGWRIRQIKEKFWECRFYADAPEGYDWKDRSFRDLCRAIEIACDALTPRRDSIE